MSSLWKNGLLALLLVLAAGCSNANSPSDSASSGTADTQSASTTSPPAHTASHDPHWSYEGETGPEYWGALSTDFETCKKGSKQSPINIDHSQLTKQTNLKPVEIHYHKAKATIQNNGHTIQVALQDKDNYILLDGTKYTLAQFHFHHPSEHQLDGKNAEIELHFVHKSDDGRSAVLGVLIKSGTENAAFKQVWSHLPAKSSETANELKEQIALTDLLPANLHSVRYTGSLTTPPCSEDVSWTVLDHPIQMSKEQIAKFAALFPDNHRPVQPLGDRTVSTEG
ncbi:carbonic anhydrase [Paenibacillus sp. CAA11]|uniref:carbonic anhydrase n=1 Tax=Paenibacillus sp. CAA11 TaxID=1532905 RepID=UPI000D37718A|nr:carbonic anhydrase family protein [Paenibacillus sp. CAA11]AWB43475.1 carbonic anhydrase [Paenibacillus sp. CAA11]